MTAITPERVQEIRARLAAATPGPWDTDGSIVWAEVIVPDPRDQAGRTPMRDRELIAQSGGADAELIAHAPDDIAALVDEVERLEKFFATNANSQFGRHLGLVVAHPEITVWEPEP